MPERLRQEDYEFKVNLSYVIKREKKKTEITPPLSRKELDIGVLQPPDSLHVQPE